VELSLARRWAPENGLALVASPNKHSVARRGGRYPAVATPSAVEPLSWPTMRNSSAESTIMAHRRDSVSLRVEPMMAVSAPPGGEAQATEVVGDELEAPKMNGFTE
jgi:hypothetical protein